MSRGLENTAKWIKRGVLNKWGGGGGESEFFSEKNRQEGRLFGTKEYFNKISAIHFEWEIHVRPCLRNLPFYHSIKTDLNPLKTDKKPCRNHARPTTTKLNRSIFAKLHTRQTQFMWSSRACFPENRNVE